MTNTVENKAKQIAEAIETFVSGANVEHLADQPGDDVLVFRIETPFVSYEIEQQIAIFAYYREDDNLIQFSDRGLYSFCVKDRSDLNLKRHRNFVKSNGYIMLGSETEEGSFVVNTPAVEFDIEEIDFPAFLGNYISLLLYSGEV